MKRPRKSNRVSWAPGVNLCQVKLFLSEDCPSKVGQKFQDHLQAKASFMLHSSTNESIDLPPGFEGSHFVYQSKDELSRIPRITWKCPSQFVFSYAWHVAAGEESKEKQDQKMREMRVLEAVYPRPSAIPPSPSVSLDVEKEDYDNSLTPFIPLIPIEEESMDVNTDVASVADNIHVAMPSQKLHQYASAPAAPISSECHTHATVTSPAYGKTLPGISSGLDANLAAASDVVAAIVSNNEQGDLIDMDLLVRIFNDPILIGKLISDHRIAGTTGNASSNTVGVPASVFYPAIPSAPKSSPAPKSTVGLLSASGLKPATASVSLLIPTSDKPANPVPFSKSLPDNPATIVPFSRPSSDTRATKLPYSKPMPEKASTPSFPLPATTPDMHRPVNRSIQHLSNGVLPASSILPPQEDTVLASGTKRTASSLVSISSSETNMISLPSAGGNLNSVANQVQPTVSTMPYQPITSSTFAMKEAFIL